MQNNRFFKLNVGGLMNPLTYSVINFSDQITPTTVPIHSTKQNKPRNPLTDSLINLSDH
jgi:hypothetical protein